MPYLMKEEPAAVMPFAHRHGMRRAVRPRTARGGLGDYCVIQPNGARICYGGTDPSATGGGPVPPVNNLPFPDGTPLGVAGSSAVYLVDNGQIRWIPDWPTYQSIFGNNTKQIRQVSAAVLALYPQGPPLTSVATAGQGANQYLAVPSVPTPETANTVAATTAPASTPTYSSMLEAGATYNPATGTYTNPDGSVYLPPGGLASNYVSTGLPATTVGASFDLTSPS